MKYLNPQDSISIIEEREEIYKRKEDDGLTQFGGTIFNELRSPSQESIKDFYISNFGNDFTDWKNIENISAKVIEITDESVIVDCLIDKSSFHYQKRSFNKNIFKYIKGLQVGKFILIRVYELPPETKLRIEDGDGIVSPSDFVIEGLFKNISSSKMFTSTPKLNKPK